MFSLTEFSAWALHDYASPRLITLRVPTMKTSRKWSSEAVACGELQCHAWKRVAHGENQVQGAEDHCVGEHKCLHHRHMCSEFIAVALLLTLTPISLKILMILFP